MKKIKKKKVPVILIHPTSMSGHALFNKNKWESEKTKQIIQSCAAQYSVLQYSSTRLNELFNKADSLCQPALKEFNSQWKTTKWPLKNCSYFVEIPEVHLHIQTFLISTKTFLDTLIQLLSAEGIITNKVHGFHKKGEIVGGQVLNLLKRSSKKTNKDVAENITKLIENGKKEWIDEVVYVRDFFTHPEVGILQIMFELQLKEKNSELEIIKLTKPRINTKKKNFNIYAESVLKEVTKFSSDLLKLLEDQNKK